MAKLPISLPNLMQEHGKIKIKGLRMMYDAIVVGASFAGLAATMQLARANRRVLVIDAGEPRNRYSDASHGFLGHDGRRPHEITAGGRKELARYPLVDFLDGLATSAVRTDLGFSIGLADGTCVSGARVILATGVSDDLPFIPGLRERWGKSVLHCPYCHGYEFAGRKLGVLATGPMSLHQALLLSDWASTKLFTQGNLALDEDELAQLSAFDVEVERSVITGLNGTSSTIETVELEDGRCIALDALFLVPTTRMTSELAAQLGCAFDDGPTGPIIRVDESKRTSIEGVYAAGDASSPMWNGSLAVAAGVLAGVSAHQSLVFQ